MLDERHQVDSLCEDSADEGIRDRNDRDPAQSRRTARPHGRSPAGIQREHVARADS